MDKHTPAATLVDAALSHAFETGSHAFLIPVPNTSPELFVALGERSQLVDMANGASNAELLEALQALLGPQDDPLVGWRGRAKTSNDHFRCEYCGVEDQDCTKLPHTDDCAVKKARAALSKARGEA